MKNKTNICEINCFNDGKCTDFPICTNDMNICCYICDKITTCENPCEFFTNEILEELSELNKHIKDRLLNEEEEEEMEEDNNWFVEEIFRLRKDNNCYRETLVNIVGIAEEIDESITNNRSKIVRIIEIANKSLKKI